MNTFQLPANLVERLGWVLVHSAWQFALIALVALLLVQATRRYSAASRYWMLLLAFAAMVASPVVTLLVIPVDESIAEVAATTDQIGPAISAALPEQAVDARPVSDGDVPELQAMTTPTLSWQLTVDHAVKPWLNVMVGIWGLGVLAFALRPMLSWHTVRRLRNVGVSPVPAAVAALLQQTSERIRLRQTVQVLQSTITRVPVVIGCLRPVILLPVSFIAGVPTSHLEAILAHELAHVSRHDFLVNLLQTLVETLFFYHPAVWWLSHRIRIERENCCDDLAVAAVGNRVEYGRALLALGELRGTSTALALGARSGSLLDRVQRLFRRDPAERTVGAGIVSVGLLAIVLIALGVWNSTLAEKPRSSADEQAARMTAKEQAAWIAIDDAPITVNGPASNRRTLRQQMQNMERAKFPENAIRKLREQIEQPVRAADFWNVPADAWTHIGQLTSLQELRIVASDLRGKPMDEIGRLTNLRRLEATNSKCNPQDLEPLRELADLKHLQVMFTVLDESGEWRKEQLGELSAAEQALVAHLVAAQPNRAPMAEVAILTDRMLASLRGLDRLKTLRLSNTYVSGRGLESLKALLAIEELDLTLIEFTPEAARIVGGLRTLKRFRYADVTDETLAELAKLPELEELEVWAGGVTDRGVDHLLKLSKLRKLAIRGSQLSDAGLQRLANLPHLESLDLSHSTGSLSATGVKRFQEQKPGCKVACNPKGLRAEPAENTSDQAQPAQADEAIGKPSRDASLDVVAEIPDAAYTRPTAKDQEVTAKIPAEAWGEPVDGLRVAIVLRSPPIDKHERLCYDIVAENVSDHDIRFGAMLDVNDLVSYCKTNLADADGKQVSPQAGGISYLAPTLKRLWLKPKERGSISTCASRLFELDEAGNPLGSPEEYHGPSYFRVKPGQYSVSAAVKLGPSMYSVDPVSKKRTVLSPAKGEWSGKLQTGSTSVALFSQPAPEDEAAKFPPLELRTDVRAARKALLVSLRDADALQGDWRATEAIGNGKPVPKELLPNIKVVFAREKMTFSPPEGGDRPVLEFTFKVDASKKPRAITLTRLVDGLAQKSGPGIYTLDGDTLKLCLSIRPETEPPTEFAAPEDSQLILLTLKKSKE